MSSSTYTYVRRKNNVLASTNDLSILGEGFDASKETFLFVSPHDDDIAIGGSLMVLAAVAEGIPVHIAIVTDGSAGYCSMEEKETIAEIRRAETYASFKMLGVPAENIHCLGIPDCQTARYQGRYAAKPGEAGEVCGFTGMQNALTKALRDVKPTRVFLPTSADLHPDHKVTHSETMISLFHAAGAIWPELGEPIPAVPEVYELAIYCDFPSAPEIQLQVDPDTFQKKLDSILAYQSQKQIASLVKSVSQAGPYEQYRPIYWELYDLKTFLPLFADAPTPAAPTGDCNCSG
jgi:LmbE family N-acetylglucosaminyl deacetylase